MSRLSQTFAFFNLDPNKFTNEWVKFNMTDVTITEKLKEFRRSERKNQKKEAKNTRLEELSENYIAINQEEDDLNLVLDGKMTKEEYRAKWVK
jgi:cell shape-determining protein MreC